MHIKCTLCNLKFGLHCTFVDRCGRDFVSLPVRVRSVTSLSEKRDIYILYIHWHLLLVCQYLYVVPCFVSTFPLHDLWLFTSRISHNYNNVMQVMCINASDNDSKISRRVGLPIFEPRQANLCLRAFRHDKFQLRMPSHSEGPGIWLSVRRFLLIHCLYERAAKVLATLRGCAGSPEPSLLA